MGANLVPGGATFRAWAPRAREVHVLGDFNSWKRSSDSQLNPIGGGQWAGFMPAIQEGAAYKFYVDGPGGHGFKRDPYARDLTFQPPFPDCNCIIHDSTLFPWHDQGFIPPAFNELVIYQLHIGTFFIKQGNPGGKFLDVLDKLDYLVALGVNAIQPLPIVEFPTEFSLGYNGTDYFSPESDYGEADPQDLQDYLLRVNRLVVARNHAPIP
jgi:1,4-alpha-glucan branching enzyme